MSDDGSRLDYGRLDTDSARLANLFERHGLLPGDRIAVIMENNLEWFIAMWAARRSGLFYVPVNWHLAAEEARYVISNSGAKVVIASALTRDLATQVCAGNDEIRLRLIVGEADGEFSSFSAAIAGEQESRPEVEPDGNSMPYSSGTTGRPKGIMREKSGVQFGTPNDLENMLTSLYEIDQDSRYLSPAPLYHSAPVGFTATVLLAGGTIIHMPRFDAEAALTAIERYRITHAQFVPTHFVRMLKLPEAVRTSYDVSSLKHVIHAAAPCAPEVKRAMIEWLGPVVDEYYSGSERCGLTAIDSPDWLDHEGSVGKSMRGAIHVVDPDSGKDVPTGEVGLIYFEDPVKFVYHGEPEKTAATFSPQGWGTHGDLGYVDQEGYLYLVDRRSDLILSGGVNIYPQEIENALMLHPAVADCAVVGLPDEEFGSRVASAIQIEDGMERPSIDELEAHCRAHLAGFKVPRIIKLVDDLPRLPSGKLLRRKAIELFAAD